MAKKMVTNASSSQNKRHQGCGKWLTKKSKSTIQPLHVKRCLVRTFKPVIFEDNTKSCKMKQSTMSQFLVEEMSSKTKENAINFNDKSALAVLVPSHRGSATELTKYEDRPGSDENEARQHEDSVDESRLGEKDHIFENVSTIYCEDGQNGNSFERNSQTLDAKGTEKLPPPLKRLRKSRYGTDEGARLENNSTGNEANFTEWFENELQVFIKQDTNAQNVRLLCNSSASKPSDSEEELPQFSEWFNHNIKTINHRESPSNQLQSPARDVAQQDFTFTQWLETNMENIKSPS